MTSGNLGTAVHEAAHALVACSFHVPLDRVFLDGRGGGATVLALPDARAGRPAPCGDDDAQFPALEVLGALATLALVLAGPAAQELLTGEAAMPWDSEGCDLDRIEDAELHVAEAVGVRASPLWGSMVRPPTIAFLRREWNLVERLALELAKARELSGAQVATLVGPLDPPDLGGALAYARHLWARHAARRVQIMP